MTLIDTGYINNWRWLTNTTTTTTTTATPMQAHIYGYGTTMTANVYIMDDPVVNAPFSTYYVYHPYRYPDTCSDETEQKQERITLTPEKLCKFLE